MLLKETNFFDVLAGQRMRRYLTVHDLFIF